jgi:hypothetical protein
MVGLVVWEMTHQASAATGTWGCSAGRPIPPWIPTIG